MAITLKESQAINDIAGLLYEFLPGKPHPYADQSISFLGVANDLGLGSYWRGGSKRPAITTLLELTLSNQRGRFCSLILQVVRRGIRYRSGKKPISREEILRLNELVVKVGFKIPDLWDPKFLDTLHSTSPKATTVKRDNKETVFNSLREQFLNLRTLEPQQRGYAFERFLKVLFNEFELIPGNSFRLVGEQFDGSFQLGSDTYIVEAKWTKDPVGNSELQAFRGKLIGKATWTRGLFISYSGFSDDGLEAFSKTGATNIICMNGQDIYLMLERKISFIDVLRFKARRAAEKGDICVSVFEIL